MRASYWLDPWHEACGKAGIEMDAVEMMLFGFVSQGKTVAHFRQRNIKVGNQWPGDQVRDALQVFVEMYLESELSAFAEMYPQEEADYGETEFRSVAVQADAHGHRSRGERAGAVDDDRPGRADFPVGGDPQSADPGKYER